MINKCPYSGEKRKQVYVHLSEIPKVPNKVVKVLVVCEHRQTDFQLLFHATAWPKPEICLAAWLFVWFLRKILRKSASYSNIKKLLTSSYVFFDNPAGKKGLCSKGVRWIIMYIKLGCITGSGVDIKCSLNF